jgi:beta-galactosidase
MTSLDLNPVEGQIHTTDGGEEKQSDARLNSSGVTVEVHQRALYSGTVNYWRYPPEVWPTLLERVKELGFDIVQTSVPWGVHESSPGIFDFGEQNPQKDLSKFLDLCRKAELFVILSIGPGIDEDLPDGGFPLRILRDSTLWALTSTDTPALSSRTSPPTVILSYACEKFYTEVAKFFDALAPVIQPHQSPNGPVVLCVVNKENAFYGRRGRDDLDYSPDSISLYRKFLSEKYSSVETLNGIYGKKYPAFSGIQPPRKTDTVEQRDIPCYLDWMEFREYLIRYALQRLAQMLRKRELSVLLAADVPPDIGTPIDTFALQGVPEISFLGMEVDPAQQDYASLARSVRYLAGTRRLAWVSTFGCGTSWISPRISTPEEEEFAILAAIMHGMSAVNFHMLVEGDRWVGTPIKRDGAYREEYANLFRRLKDFLFQNQVWNSKKIARALVLVPFALERYLRLFSTMDQAFLGLLRLPAAFSEAQSSPGYPTESARQSVVEENNWISEIYQSLEQAQVEYNISDTHAPLEELNRYGMIFLPAIDYMDAKEQEKLLAFVDHGGHLVIGLARPAQDASLPLASALAKFNRGPEPQVHGAGKIILLTKLDSESVKNILRPDMGNSIVPDNLNLRLTIREGTPTLVFLANPTGKTQQTSLVSPRPLHGVWNAPGEMRTSPVMTELKPFTIQVWEVI